MRDQVPETEQTQDAYRLLTVREVEKRLSMSHATLYRLMNAGRFPKPLNLGPQVRRWRSDEVEAWLEARSEEREAA